MDNLCKKEQCKMDNLCKKEECKMDNLCKKEEKTHPYVMNPKS